MRTSDYWKKRIEKRYEKHFSDFDDFSRKLKRSFYAAQEHYNERIAYYLSRIARNGQISEADAMRLIDERTLSAYNVSLDEFISWAMLGDNASDEVRKLIDDASSLAHISHYQAMSKEMEFIATRLWYDAGKEMEAFLAIKHADNFYHMAKDLQDFSGKYKRVTGLSARNLKALISAPWAPDGKDFSERIWENRTRLAAKLQHELANVVTGVYGKDTAAEHLARLSAEKSEEGFNVSLGNAKRLVHSELHHVLDTGQIKAFREQGVPKYQFLATLDTKTTPFCRAHDHKVYLVRDYVEGVTAPPHGPWCRSTIIPRYDDDEADDGWRAARNQESGKSELVSAALSYDEWMEKYVVIQ